MDTKQVGRLWLKGAVEEGAFLLDMLLSRYESFKSVKPRSLTEITEASYVFNAFVRSAKSALALMEKQSGRDGSEFFDRIGNSDDLRYLMQGARGAITHGYIDLLSGGIEVSHDGENILVFVCSRVLNKKETGWIEPPKQDAISLAIDYFLVVIDEARKCEIELQNSSPITWRDTQDWIVDSIRAAPHIPNDILDISTKALEKLLPSLAITSPALDWCEDLAEKYKKLRTSVYPTVLIGKDDYNVSFPVYGTNEESSADRVR